MEKEHWSTKVQNQHLYYPVTQQGSSGLLCIWGKEQFTGKTCACTWKHGSLLSSFWAAGGGDMGRALHEARWSSARGFGEPARHNALPRPPRSPRTKLLSNPLHLLIEMHRSVCRAPWRVTSVRRSVLVLRARHGGLSWQRVTAASFSLLENHMNVLPALSWRVFRNRLRWKYDENNSWLK